MEIMSKNNSSLLITSNSDGHFATTLLGILFFCHSHSEGYCDFYSSIVKDKIKAHRVALTNWNLM